MKIQSLKSFNLSRIGYHEQGRVMAPLLMWMLGVPGGIVILIWFFFFKG